MGKKNPYILIFSNDSFLLKNTFIDSHLPPFTCEDTIAFGKWRLDKDLDLIRVQSPDYLISSKMGFSLEEKIIEHTDSIYFEINNPIESHYEKFFYSEKAREISYIINIKSNSEALIHQLNYKEFKSNKRVIKRKNYEEVLEISIMIIVNSNFSEQYLNFKDIYTDSYKVENTKSNHFVIDIPNLSHCKIGSKILNQDFMKIVDANTIEWDGETYIKKRGN